MAKQQIVLSEKYLLSALDRIAKSSAGYAVLYISASKLKPKHRHPKFLKILEKFFDGVVGLSTGVFFPLTNGDFAILGRGFTQAAVDEAVEKLREGTSNDPILHGKKSSDFAAVLNFPENFASFYRFIANMVENGQNTNVQDNMIPEARPLEAGEVEQVLSILDEVDISELVKRQSVVQIKGANQFKVDFQEFFVAVKDLNQQFDGIDLQANRWLYFYMLQNLDKRMLAAFFSAKLRQWPDFIGVNLSLKSIYSQEFIDFAKLFEDQNKKIVVEVQLTDIFNNLSQYFEVKEILARGQHKILIDGVSASSLKFLNIKSLNPDMIKIFWEPLWEFCPDNEDIKKIVAEFGKENLILAKCDSSQSLSWGIRHGFNLFQGPFMDNLEIAMIRQQCPDAARCTVKDCLKRKRLLSGSEHEFCTQKNVLEKLL